MKLYYAPGACSLSDHIALHEAGLAFEHERVDLKAKKTQSGKDYAGINPRGYVPALELDGGEILTENVAILDWIASQGSKLMPAGPLGRSRQIEALAFFAAELHRGFHPFFGGASDEDKADATKTLGRRFGQAADMMAGDYLFGDSPMAADCYLFVMTLWAEKFGLELPSGLAAFRDRMRQRPAVRKALEHEGLLESA